MSAIDELIAELCSDGVEWKRLGEVGAFTRGSGIQKKDFVEDGMPCIHYGQIYTKFGLFTDCVLSKIPEEQYAKSKKANPGDVIFAITSENIEDVCTPLVWEGDQPVAISGHSCAYMTESIVPRYLAYVATGQDFQTAKQKVAKGTKVIEVAPVDLARVEIPVPPLEIQQEIVRILDTFTELTDELTDKLAEEVTARKQQYAYYRDRVLSPESLEAMDGKPVEMMRIEDICSRICSGGTPSSKVDEYYDGDIPWVRTQDVDYKLIDMPSATISKKGLDSSAAKWIPEGCVIVAMYGATAAKVAMNAIPVTTNQACCNLEINPERAMSRYVFHWLAASYENLKALGEGSQNNISGAKVRRFEIPVPSLETQQKVVGILDRFDMLTTSLTDDLPAEIEARRAQYGYYRDCLLDFPRKEGAAS